MLEKLNSKDARALKLGAAGVAAMIILLFGFDLKERWATANASFEATNTRLATLDAAVDLTETKYAGLKSIVPVFEMPVEKEEQKFLFMDSLNEQLKKANINSMPWEETGSKSKLLTDLEFLRLRTTGKCNITQIFDLLASLKENPYLISIEELIIKRDMQNQQQVDFDITVSSLVKSSEGLYETRLHKSK